MFGIKTLSLLLLNSVHSTVELMCPVLLLAASVIENLATNGRAVNSSGFICGSR